MALGAVANRFLIVLSHTSFAFGSAPVPRDATAFAFGVAAFQLLIAVATLAIAVSSRAAAVLR